MELLRRLDRAQVRYVVVGGMAGIILGSPLMTEDVDVCCPMTKLNMARIVKAVHGIHARFRFHPDEPPLPDDPKKLEGYRNLNLATDLGIIDLMDQIDGLGAYTSVYRHSRVVTMEGRQVRVLTLDALIKSKRAAGRDKDRLGVLHLEAIKKRRDKKSG